MQNKKGIVLSMKNILQQGCSELGISLNERQISQLVHYASLLTEWNKKINLTAITAPDEIAVKHFLDSLTPLLTGRVQGSVIDVGTGAGFPGLVLKIAKPEIKLTLLDSLNKRLDFLKFTADELSLDNVEFVHARAEDAGKNVSLRASFDTAVSRAVANMTVLSELCIPFLKIGGNFLALKGPLASDELTPAKRAINILGGKAEDVFEIPFCGLSHKIIIVKKEKKTPLKYPRKPGIPTKNPLLQCYNTTKGVGK